MNKRCVSVLFSFLVLLIAIDAKPQFYGTNGYGQMGYGQTTTVVRQQQTPVGTTRVVERQESGIGGTTYTRTVQQNGLPYPTYGKK